MSTLSFTPPKPVKLNGSRTYYFRLRVPSDLKEIYASRTEFKYSLHTQDRKEAQSRIMLKAQELEQEFAEHRRQRSKPPMPPRLAFASGASGAPGELTACVNTALAVSLIPFDEVSELELKRLALLYPSYALKLLEEEDSHPDIMETEADAARKEWEEQQELFVQLHASKGLPYTPELFPATQGASIASTNRKRAHAHTFVSTIPAYLAKRDYGPVIPIVTNYLAQHGIQAPQPDAQRRVPIRYPEFCLSILQEELRIQCHILQRLNGDLFNGGDTIAASQVQMIMPSPVAGVSQDTNKDIDILIPSEDNPRFREVWDGYLAERNPTQATVRNFEPSIRRFTELVGNLPIKAVTKSHIRKFKDALLITPAYMSNALKALSYPEILRKIENKTIGEEYSLLSAKTINNKNIAAISTVCSHALRNGYIDNNPCAGIRVQINSSVENEGPVILPYSQEDLHSIFQKSALFSSTPETALGTLPTRMSIERLQDYRWLTLMALFTGARLEELGQLDVADIKQEQNVWYIYIHADAATGRTVKNKASRRKTPIHPRLIELGFIDFVHALKEQGESKLFSTFDGRATGSRTTAFSKWWERFTEAIGVKGPDKRKRFHSFRHCFKREMVNTMQVSKKLIDALQGHTVSGVSAQYGRDEDGMQYALPVLFEAISKATFSNVTAGLEELMRMDKNKDKKV